MRCKIAKTENQYPIFYAGVSLSPENAIKSSSGGVFYELAKTVISKGGIVYGAAQIGVLNVAHIRATNIEEIKKLRKSKYLRSNLSGIYNQVKEDLDKGYWVMFSGVGCQIAGLQTFLKHDYDKLINCEVVCHGVPLKTSWEKYIREQESKLESKLTELVFRDKREGWKNNCICERYSNGLEVVNLSEYHPVHSLYLSGINMEACCGKCKYQKIPRIADITLADYWKASENEYKEYTKSGVSLVSVNTKKGQRVIKEAERLIKLSHISEEKAKNSCRHLARAPYEHPSRSAYEKMIENKSFSEIKFLFQTVGEVILPEKLHFLDLEDTRKVIDIFLLDTFEVIYYVNKECRICGIATFGDFIKKISNNEKWINEKFFNVKYEEGYIGEVKKIFDAHPKVNRIPIVNDEGKLLFEVRRHVDSNGIHDSRKFLLAIAELKRTNRKYLLVNRPDTIDGFEYSLRQQIRMKNQITFSKVLQNPMTYEKELIDLFGTRNDIYAYVEKLGTIPPVIEIDGMYQHLDQIGECVNVIGGKRITCAQPEGSLFCIHIYGRCGVFGYAVSDSETLPSALQRKVNAKGLKVEVVNHGLWGADDDKILSNFFRDLRKGEIKSGDIVIFYMMIPRIEEEFANLLDSYIDTTQNFHTYLRKGCNFYDCPGHMNAIGYEYIAAEIFEWMEQHNSFIENVYETSHERALYPNIMPSQISEYVDRITQLIPESFLKNNDVIGAIVMNCNPFTRGHRYLIEETSKQVDKLLIFVVEEDKSIFPFPLRYKMVCEGTRDLDNVLVLPSGMFIISSITFPEYFTKEEKQNAIVVPSLDVNIFGEYIAREFGIKVRFVGTEPNDKVTNQYNKVLKNILPRYGVNVIEIDRLVYEGAPISASYVRDKIKSNDMRDLDKVLPTSTIECLRSVGMIGDGVKERRVQP